MAAFKLEWMRYIGCREGVEMEQARFFWGLVIGLGYMQCSGARTFWPEPV